MTATDDECREVAKRLRRDVGESSCIDYAVFRIAHEVLGIEHVTGAKAAHMLADLIDTTCDMDVLDTGEVADYECSEHIMHCCNCNAEFGYVLYSEDRGVSMDDKPRFCPNCRARVLDDGN